MFKFLHLFSGPRDVIGEKLVEKGKKENLTVEVVSVDLKINHSIKDKKLAADLSKEQPYNTLLEQTKEGEYDGATVASRATPLLWRDGIPCRGTRDQCGPELKYMVSWKLEGDAGASGPGESVGYEVGHRQQEGIPQRWRP